MFMYLCVASWCPDLTVSTLCGDKETREQQKLRVGHTDVLVTTYEICIIEKATLRKIAWHYLYIDEAHRIKNENSLLSQVEER